MVLDVGRRTPGHNGTTKTPIAFAYDDPCDDCTHWAGCMNSEKNRNNRVNV
jgi:hypothetical protein